MGYYSFKIRRLLTTLNHEPILYWQQSSKRPFKKELSKKKNLMYEVMVRHFLEKYQKDPKKYNFPDTRELADYFSSNIKLLEENTEINLDEITDIPKFIENHIRELKKFKVFYLDINKLKDKLIPFFEHKENKDDLIQTFKRSLTPLKLTEFSKKSGENIKKILNILLKDILPQKLEGFNFNYETTDFNDLVCIDVVTLIDEENKINTLTAFSKRAEILYQLSSLEKLPVFIKEPKNVYQISKIYLLKDFLTLQPLWEDLLKLIISNLTNIDKEYVMLMIETYYNILGYYKDLKLSVYKKEEIDRIFAEILGHIKKIREDWRGLSHDIDKKIYGRLDDLEHFYSSISQNKNLRIHDFKDNLMYYAKAFNIIQHFFNTDWFNNPNSIQEMIESLKRLESYVPELNPLFEFIILILKWSSKFVMLDFSPYSEKEFYSTLFDASEEFSKNFMNHELTFQVYKIGDFFRFHYKFEEFQRINSTLTIMTREQLLRIKKIIEILDEAIVYLIKLDPLFITNTKKFEIFCYLLSEKYKFQFSIEMYDFFIKRENEENLFEFNELLKKIGPHILKKMLLFYLVYYLFDEFEKEIDNESRIKTEIKPNKIKSSIADLFDIIESYGDNKNLPEDIFREVSQELGKEFLDLEEQIDNYDFREKIKTLKEEVFEKINYSIFKDNPKIDANFEPTPVEISLFDQFISEFFIAVQEACERTDTFKVFFDLFGDPKKFQDALESGAIVFLPSVSEKPELNDDSSDDVEK